MTYTLTQLAAGSYDIYLNGEVVGAVVRGGTRISPVWIAELLYDMPAEDMPAPFKEVEREFLSFQELRLWLGNPPIVPGEGYEPSV
jgi:hypothetical protein